MRRQTVKKAFTLLRVKDWALSIALLKDGNKRSNIVPHFNGEIITTPRSHAYYIVTEHGAVNLAGSSTWERAEKLISIADPDLRDELIAAAEQQKIWRRSSKN